MRDHGRRQWWAPRDGGWWVAFPFTVGSILFMAGAVLPALAFVPSPIVTVTFFIGSSLYLIGALAQVGQEAAHLLRGRYAASRSARHHARVALAGGLIQAFGAVLFQTNLTAAFARDLTPFEQEAFLWVPDLTGSVLFLTASTVFFVLNRPIQSQPLRDQFNERSERRLAALNIAGSAFFIISALGAYISPLTGQEFYPFVANLGTLVGGGFFLVSSIPGIPRVSTSR